MQSTAARVAGAVVVVAIVVVGFIALSGGDSEDSTTATATTATTETSDAGGEADKPDKDKGGKPAAAEVPVIEVKGGAPVGGVQELTFNAGEKIEFKVESDTAVEVHVHGYDIAQEVSAGGSTEFSFPADIEGIFEAELEETATEIAEITVNP